MTEEPLQFGENGRLFGILTLPDTPVRSASARCVLVLLSAGLMHRVDRIPRGTSKERR